MLLLAPRKAVMLCEQDNDPTGADAVRHWIDVLYR